MAKAKLRANGANNMPQQRAFRLALAVILLLVLVEAPVGYFTGLLNWTEYYRQEFKVGGIVHRDVSCLSNPETNSISLIA
jgi:predicted Abi (CAAX) family protease